jgi:glycosyltransferase involved in cell wall biosynthesis
MPLVARVPRLSGQLRIVDTLDVMHLRDASLREAGLPAECGVSREEEIALLEQFDVVVAIQDEERRVLEQMLPGKRVMAVHHACAPDPQPARRPAVVFVGSSGSTNARGIETFVEQAWPEIVRSRPDARLEVVGSVCQSEPLQRAAARPEKRILLRGPLPRIVDAYDGPSVVVCPLWAGSGLKIKMVEALSYGKAVVASPIAAQGLRDGIGKAFLTAQTPASFAPAVLRLLENETERLALGAAAVAYATDRFGPEAVYRELEQTLRMWHAKGAAGNEAA